MTKLIDQKTFKVLIYLYEKGGEVKGFRMMSQEIGINKAIMSKILELLELESEL